MARNWVDCLHRMGGPLHFRAGDKVRCCPQLGRSATQPLLSWGSPTLQSGGGGGDQMCSTIGHIGYITLAILGVPWALERGTQSDVAPNRGDRLHNPYYLGDPQCFKAGDNITCSPNFYILAA